MDFVWKLLFGQASTTFLRGAHEDSERAGPGPSQYDDQNATSAESKDRSFSHAPLTNSHRNNCSTILRLTGSEDSTSSKLPLSASHRKHSSTIFPHTSRPRPFTKVSRQSNKTTTQARVLHAHFIRRQLEKARLATLHKDVETIVTSYYVFKIYAPWYEELMETDPQWFHAVPEAKQAHRIFEAESLMALQKHVKEIVEEIEGPVFEKPRSASMEAQLDPETIYKRALPLVKLLKELHFCQV